MQGWNQLRQQIRRDRVDHPDAQRPAHRIAPRTGDFLQADSLLEHAPGLSDDTLAQCGNADIGGSTLEQRRAELPFDFLERHRQGRLADVTGLGRLAEVALAGEGHDVAHFGQGHLEYPNFCRSTADSQRHSPGFRSPGSTRSPTASRCKASTRLPAAATMRLT